MRKEKAKLAIALQQRFIQVFVMPKFLVCFWTKANAWTFEFREFPPGV